MLADTADTLIDATEQFLAGFDDLRDAPHRPQSLREGDPEPAKDMAGLYSIIDGEPGCAKR